ncbi:uncharacterized protein LOC111330683 [Stylophora pistillata]|uniref:uncharacterized protein LOC111330683 n=1 Tax=Stylophora pistillata TaxID=50429 RepID=UPI000C054D1F|nr:uncharacterized protein LOC111330683 [Stylophora pistillata]
MVDKSNATVRDALKVILTEEDIPGAKIPRETVEQCSVVQLKRWLLCRGAKTTGNKKALITRVQDYIKHGLDVKYLRDPDGGLHLLRKKAQLGVLEEEEPQLNQFLLSKACFKLSISFCNLLFTSFMLLFSFSNC